MIETYRPEISAIFSGKTGKVALILVGKEKIHTKKGEECINFSIKTTNIKNIGKSKILLTLNVKKEKIYT